MRLIQGKTLALEQSHTVIDVSDKSKVDVPLPANGLSANGIFPIFSEKGPLDTVVVLSGSSAYAKAIATFGEADTEKYGYYYTALLNWLQAGGEASVIRLGADINATAEGNSGGDEYVTIPLNMMIWVPEDLITDPNISDYIIGYQTEGGEMKPPFNRLLTPSSIDDVATRVNGNVLTIPNYVIVKLKKTFITDVLIDSIGTSVIGKGQTLISSLYINVRLPLENATKLNQYDIKTDTLDIPTLLNSSDLSNIDLVVDVGVRETTIGGMNVKCLSQHFVRFSEFDDITNTATLSDDNDIINEYGFYFSEDDLATMQATNKAEFNDKIKAGDIIVKLDNSKESLILDWLNTYKPDLITAVSDPWNHYGGENIKASLPDVVNKFIDVFGAKIVIGATDPNNITKRYVNNEDTGTLLLHNDGNTPNYTINGSLVGVFQSATDNMFNLVYNYGGVSIAPTPEQNLDKVLPWWISEEKILAVDTEYGSQIVDTVTLDVSKEIADMFNGVKTFEIYDLVMTPGDIIIDLGYDEQIHQAIAGFLEKRIDIVALLNAVPYKQLADIKGWGTTNKFNSPKIFKYYGRVDELDLTIGNYVKVPLTTNYMKNVLKWYIGGMNGSLIQPPIGILLGVDRYNLYPNITNPNDLSDLKALGFNTILVSNDGIRLNDQLCDIQGVYSPYHELHNQLIIGRIIKDVYNFLEGERHTLTTVTNVSLTSRKCTEMLNRNYGTLVESLRVNLYYRQEGAENDLGTLTDELIIKLTKTDKSRKIVLNLFK